MGQLKSVELASDATIGFFNDMLAYGLDKEQLLEKSGLTEAELATDSPDKHLALWQAADTLLSCPEIGLHIGSMATPNNRGVLGQIFLSSKNLRTAIENVLHHFNVLIDYMTFDVQEHGPYTRIVFAYAHGPVHHYGIDSLCAAIFNWGKAFLGYNVPLKQLSFQHKKPQNTKPYTTLFDCPIYFKQPENAFVIPTSLLSVEHKQYSEFIYNLLNEHLIKVSTQQAFKPKFSEKIKNTLVKKLPKRRFSAEDISAALGMSKRTYHRKLLDEGLSHQTLLDDIRKNLAMSHLKHPEENLKNVAFKLGFSDNRSFSRAFKRWTGISPKQYIDSYS